MNSGGGGQEEEPLQLSLTIQEMVERKQAELKGSQPKRLELENCDNPLDPARHLPSPERSNAPLPVL